MVKLACTYLLQGQAPTVGRLYLVQLGNPTMIEWTTYSYGLQGSFCCSVVLFCSLAWCKHGKVNQNNAMVY